MELAAYEKEHLALVSETAAECTVLLKKDGSFPLKSAGKIAAFGNGIRHTVKGGTGSGEVNSKFSVNIEQGLKEAGFEIASEKWLDDYDAMRVNAKKQFIKDIKAEAKALHTNAMMYSMGKAMPEPEHNLAISGDADTAIYVVTRDSGEGNDRQAKPGDVMLVNSEIRDILACNEKYKNFMLVLNVGGVIDLTPVKDVKNILILSQLGVVTGTVLADILLGKQVPSGKLATTWSAWEDYSTIGTFGDVNDTDYKEGIYVGYRYFDSVGKKALFPFGYGLSYTDFEMSDAAVSLEKETVKISVNVKNTGNYSGKEIAEVYLSAPAGKLDKPYQELAAYGKTGLLKPGESTSVTIEFKLSDHASYDTETASYILEKGDYIVRVGRSSTETTVASKLALSETVTVLKAKNVIGDSGFKDFVPENTRTSEIPADVPTLTVNPDDISKAEVSYDADYEVDDIIKSLTDEELVFMNIGQHDPDRKGLQAVIGNASPHIAGAAGETTSRFTSKGIGYLTMSDGPAGLRLAKNYYEDAEGAHGIGTSMMPESMLEYMSGFARFIMNLLGLGGSKAPKNAEVKHQYATAIPIGTAIAQSFNCDLAKAYGDMVGSEMEMFGVNLWLAPALNIHRSILCGRNFEYYSEDPLVSGLMAAAITEGVQKHPTAGTTIKHYAANNQEINRYACSSNVSERAMREIYLKGFGICVRKAQPHAVMTSYNLLNGTHTNEHRGLTEDILRSEFGYEGIVMTDWVIAGMPGTGNQRYRTAIAADVAKAGGDVFMPGSKADYDSVLGALKDGSLSRKQLEIEAKCFSASTINPSFSDGHCGCRKSSDFGLL